MNGDRIINAIELAGGVTEKADLSKVNLAFVLSDGNKIKIPSIDDVDVEKENYISLDGGKNVIIEGNGGTIGGSGGKVNINVATQTELETLTGIGPSIAAKIIEYRNKNGKFKTKEDVKKVSGVGNEKYNGIKDEITVK